MKNQIVEWEIKDYSKEVDSANKKKSLSKKEILAKYKWTTQNKKGKEEVVYTPNWPINKKLLDHFRERYKNYKSANILFSSLPLMFIWFILFFNLFSHSLTHEDILEYAKTWIPAIIILTLVIFIPWFYTTIKAKRLYDQLCNWRLITKELKILYFNLYIDKIIKYWYNRYEPDHVWISILAWDWNKKYESDKIYSFKMNEIDYAEYYRKHEIYAIISSRAHRIYRILRLLWLIRKPQLPAVEYVIIWRKKYSLGDKINVYIDEKWGFNYYFYLKD
jgi:hypothetical protein